MINLFITGVEQNSDKIFVTAGLTAVMQSLGYSSGVYKPVDTTAVKKNGFLQSSDLSLVKFIDPYIKTYFSYLLRENSSPLLAAALESLTIEKNVVLKDFQSIQDVNEILVVEGTSGLASPLNKNFLEEDVIKMLDLPLLFVISAKNPSVNNALLSINRAKETGINVRGIVFNNYPKQTDDTNIKLMPRLIEEYTDAKVLGILPDFSSPINPNDLITETLNSVDIESVFNVKIAKLSF